MFEVIMAKYGLAWGFLTSLVLMPGHSHTNYVSAVKMDKIFVCRLLQKPRTYPREKFLHRKRLSQKMSQAT